MSASPVTAPLRFAALCAALVAGLGGLASPGQAETLADAIAVARKLNPRVLAARSRSRAVEQGVARARSGWMPTVTAHGNVGTSPAINAPVTTLGQYGYTAGFDITISQPLYDGGRTSSALGVARAAATAERAGARATEQQLLEAAVAAYADVVLHRRLVGLNERVVKLLAVILEATLRRRGVREATAADVAQARAAVAGARAQLELARANLQGSEASFEELLLHAPGRLDPAPPLGTLVPGSREAALLAAERTSPMLAAARARERAALHGVDLAAAQYAPSVSLQGGYQRRYGDLATGDVDGAFAKVVATVPLYTGGMREADVRAARFNHAASVHQIADVRAQLRSSVLRAWAQLAAARKALSAIEAQHAANRKALGGVLEEQKIGQRSVLDVINAQQAVLASETSLEQTRRNRLVAEFALVSLAGRVDEVGSRPPPHRRPEARRGWSATVQATTRGR